jgi:transposase-like protein
MKKRRKRYTPEEKVAILRRHLLDKEPISKLCGEPGLQPTDFYRWQKECCENGASAFEQKRPTNHSAEQERTTCLEKKIRTKDEVLAELMAEHVAPTTERDWGSLIALWVPHDPRAQNVDFVRRWSDETEIGAGRFIVWLDITASRCHDWRERSGIRSELPQPTRLASETILGESCDHLGGPFPRLDLGEMGNPRQIIETPPQEFLR